MSKKQSNAAVATETTTNVVELPINVFNRRITGVLLFSCIYSNPQGDPDSENSPRVDDNSYGIVTAQGLKRKIRDVWAMQGHNIHVSRGADLSKAIIEAGASLGYDVTGKKGHNLSQAEKAQVILAAAKIYTDIRAFGGVLTSLNEGVCGPVQFTPAISIDPVSPIEMATTRLAVANEKELETKDRTMGRVALIPYGLYRCEFSISGWDAAKTGFTNEDVEELIKAMVMMFDLTKSTGRSKLVIEKLLVFEHETRLGSAQDHKILQALKISKKDPSAAPRCYDDYNVEVDTNYVNRLKGITLREIV